VQIQQVILNLVVNARDAMPAGGQITVKTANIKLENAAIDEYFTTPPKPGNYVVLEVTDTGSGISKDALSHVFEPFFTTKLEGSGLGLSTSHGIASQSSGYMSVRSQAGRGTTVKFYLPRADEISVARETA
jgi:signal transduction histidine kinase